MLDNEHLTELAMPYNFNHLMKLCATHSGGNLSKREVTFSGSSPGRKSNLRISYARQIKYWFNEDPG
jgi:hypothetical protein